MNKENVLIIYDGPAFTFKLGLAISGSKKGWLFIQHEDCKWMSIFKLVDFKNIHENVEIQPYALSIKPFEEIFKETSFDGLNCPKIKPEDIETFIKTVALSVYNRVWEDIKKQLTEGE